MFGIQQKTYQACLPGVQSQGLQNQRNKGQEKKQTVETDPQNFPIQNVVYLNFKITEICV